MKFGTARPSRSAHARAVGVEDADNLGVHAVVAVVGDGHRLGEPLGLVVDAARPDRVHVAPVRLTLRVLQRVAVDLGGRRQHEPRALGLGEAQGLVRAEGAHLQRLNRQFEVVDRARRARPVQDDIHGAVHVDVVGDVVFDEDEVPAAQVGDVGQIAGQKVVDADHRVAAIEQRLGEVRPDEPGGTGDDDARLGHAVPTGRVSAGTGPAPARA